MAILLVLLSALLHATWNALLKREPDKDLAGPAVIGIAAAAALLVAAAVALVGGQAPFADRTALAFSVAAGVFEAGYFITLVLALERAPLGLVYTVSRGGAILLVWPLSVWWLHEPITAAALGGSALLVAGLALAGLDPAGDQRGARPAAAAAILCAACIAGYHLCYKRAMAAEPSAAAVFAVALAVALPLNLARLSRARRHELPALLRRRPGPLLVAGLVCAASFLVFLLALRDAGAGLVLTLRNSSVLFAVLLGWLLGEPPSRRALAGASLVAVGAALLGAPR